MPILNGDHISEFDTFGVNPKADNLRSVIDALRAKMTPEQIEALENASRDIDVDAVRTAYAIECERSERKWSSVKPEKLSRVVVESAKQCDRAWFMEIGEPISFVSAIAEPGAVIADGSGDDAALLTLAGTPVVLIGPEGGWSDGERAMMGAHSVSTLRLGGNVLRLETAACAAAAVMSNHTRKANQ